MIIEPACRLAHNLHLSVDLFTLPWTPYARMRPGYRARAPPNFRQFECTDMLAQGKVLKCPRGQKTSPEENIDYILDIFPGLCCQKVKCDVLSDVKVLRKPKVLVAVTGREQSSSLLGIPVAEDGILLGVMYDQVSKDRGVGRSKRQ